MVNVFIAYYLLLSTISALNKSPSISRLNFPPWSSTRLLAILSPKPLPSVSVSYTHLDNGQEPKGEEKTVLITDSTLIYTQEDGTQTQAQLSDISEGMMIKVKMAEDSDMQSSQVTAQSITVSERKERPEKQSDTQTNSQENQSSVDTEEK